MSAKTSVNHIVRHAFFSVLLVLRGHSFFSSPPQRLMTSDFQGFSIPDFIHYIYLPILILEKEPVFPFSMLSAKQGNYRSTIFITSLVSPWLGIEPRNSRTWCQHSTTRLSRRRLRHATYRGLLKLLSAISYTNLYVMIASHWEVVPYYFSTMTWPLMCWQKMPTLHTSI